jgi:transcriptional regulator NrdR family protein
MTVLMFMVMVVPTNSAENPEIAQMWKVEEAMSVEERRKRYRCGKNFNTLESVLPWTVQFVKRGWPSAHKQGVKLALPVR